jgi:hypothetical protein
MSPDNIDSLLVSVVDWLEKQGCNINFDDDPTYDAFEQIFYDKLEPLCTKDRNYN